MNENPIHVALASDNNYFTDYMSASWAGFLTAHNITTLSAMLWWMTGIAVIKAVCCALAMLRQKK